MLLLFAILLYHLLYVVNQGPARCQKILLDGKQVIALAEVRSQSDQNHARRQKICGPDDDRTKW